MSKCFDCGLSIHPEQVPRVASGQLFHPTASHCVSALLEKNDSLIKQVARDDEHYAASQAYGEKYRRNWVDACQERERLRAENERLRAAIEWIADNTGRDTWLSQFERRFVRGDVDDLLAAIGAARGAGEVK